MAEVLQKISGFIIGIFKFHKLKVFTLIASALFFFIVMFPFEDLSDLVTEQIAAVTQNQVFLTFDDLNISLAPAPGVSMENVKLETAQLPAIEASTLSLYPSIAGALAFKKGAVLKAKGLFKGQVNVEYKQGDLTEEKVQLHEIHMDLEDLDLASMKEFLNSPISPNGKVNLNAEFKLDFDFKEQPDGDFLVTSNKLTLPESNLPTPFGELPFPMMNFSNINMKGRIVASELILEEISLGAKEDPLFARIKGKLGLKFTQRAGRVIPVFSAYDIRTQLRVQPGIGKTLSLFLNFIDKFRRKEAQTDVYTFRARGREFGPPPELTALNKFD